MSQVVKKKRVLCVVGTRPEAIKMAPVILALREMEIDVRVLATAQHRQMLDQVLEFFGIETDIDLNLMRDNQSLGELTARILSKVEKVLVEERPDVVLAQGDTTTVMTIAMACFYHRIPFGHVEAGLRTGDIFNPYPEEFNRVVAGRIARWHFAPTDGSRKNLLKEGVSDKNIMVTGNTVIDALLFAVEKTNELSIPVASDRRMVLVTAHRRENFGEPLINICRALRRLAEDNKDVYFLYPVHPNPNVKHVAHELLGNCDNIHLCDPLGYPDFVAAMKRSFFIISDSGGVQEEAPVLGKPVLVLRNETERPEAVQVGVVKLVGSDTNQVVSAAQKLLDDNDEYKKMAKGASPYGDGMASLRIRETLRKYLFR